MSKDIPSFDVLLDIAQHDPQRLEQLRAQLTNSQINSAPKELRARLRGLQFQIDIKRELAKTPLAACIQLSQMMQQSFEEMRYALNAPSKNLIFAEYPDHQSADIIPFPKK